jgi:MFS family permease
LKPAAHAGAGRLVLADCYLIEGLNAYGTTLFFLGVFFHARLLHGFSDTANLLLAATQGGAYVLSTRAGGRYADRVGPVSSVAIGLSGMCLALVLGWQTTQGWALFAAVALYSLSTAFTWPALEAAIARAPGSIALPRRTGLYNLVWSFTGSAGFFAGGAIFAFDPNAVFWVPLIAHVLEIAWLAARTRSLQQTTHQNKSAASDAHAMAFPQTITGEGRREAETAVTRDELVTHSGNLPISIPGTAKGWREAGAPDGAQLRASTDGGAQRQDPEASTGPAVSSSTALSPEMQTRFLTSAWVANGLNYFLFGAFAALAPTLGERLGLHSRQMIWLVSAYLFARSVSFLLFWRWSGWEYSRGWLAASLALPPAALAVVFFAADPNVVTVALAALGALSGLAYSISLHASLDREGGEGEGGGLHEWVIGLGGLLGPFAGAAGVRLQGGIAGAGGLVTACGALAALIGLIVLLRRPAPPQASAL